MNNDLVLILIVFINATINNIAFPILEVGNG